MASNGSQPATVDPYPQDASSAAADVEHLDVLVIGAGLSGVGAGCHLTMKQPGKTFAILESRESMGGTWDLFRYPGIRSDSDMFTLGYSFKPWLNPKSIADGPSILSYIHETAAEYGVDRRIRYQRHAVRAEWSTEQARWSVHIRHTDTGEMSTLTCDFLFLCTGYYRYDEGYAPEFPGQEQFQGQIVHPQHWPEDLDYAGKRVVVIGSGATAVTLVPSMADTAAHVTMLQRSPTYIVSMPDRDPIATRLRKRLSPRRAYAVIRWKNVLMTMLGFQLSRKAPELMKKAIRKGVERQLPAGYDVDTHFKPRYNPWDQRMCLVPNGDLFEALKGGRASIVTDHVDTFTERGIQLKSGEQLEADIIVTATGLNMLALGGLQISVDGKDVQLSETVAYKGAMFSGVPNLATAIGYTNASWTLKCDLVCEYVCRMLDHMDRGGFDTVVPRWPEPALPDERLIDLTSGYVLRAADQFPKQGRRPPWRLYQNYLRDIFLFKRAPLEDNALQFLRNRTPSRERERSAA